MIKISETKALKMLNDNKIDELKLYIEKSIYNQQKVNVTEKKSIKAFQSLAKKFKKHNNIRSLQGAFIDGGRLCLCDGYRAIRMKNTDIPCEMVEEGEEVLKLTDFFYELDSQFEIQLNNKDIIVQYKIHKGTKEKDVTVENKGVYLYEDDKIRIGFNVKYLYDMTKIFDFEKCEIKVSSRVNPMIITDKETGNDGLILPIRLAEKV